jgi:hypothetical protein
VRSRAEAPALQLESSRHHSGGQPSSSALTEQAGARELLESSSGVAASSSSLLQRPGRGVAGGASPRETGPGGSPRVRVLHGAATEAPPASPLPGACLEVLHVSGVGGGGRSSTARLQLSLSLSDVEQRRCPCSPYASGGAGPPLRGGARRWTHGPRADVVAPSFPWMALDLASPGVDWRMEDLLQDAAAGRTPSSVSWRRRIKVPVRMV